MFELEGVDHALHSQTGRHFKYLYSCFEVGQNDFAVHQRQLIVFYSLLAAHHPSGTVGHGERLKQKLSTITDTPHWS